MASAKAKVVLGAFLTCATVTLPPFLGLVASVFVNAAWPGMGWIIGVAVGAAFAVPFIECLLWLFRYAAWLDDTTLVVRGTFGTRRCDLATATRLDLDTVTEMPVPPAAPAAGTEPDAGGVPRLVAYDAATGRRVSLPLVLPGTRMVLAAPKLHAIADAILAGRDHGRGAASAHDVAAALRSLAD